MLYLSLVVKLNSHLSYSPLKLNYTLICLLFICSLKCSFALYSFVVKCSFAFYSFVVKLSFAFYSFVVKLNTLLPFIPL